MKDAAVLHLEIKRLGVHWWIVGDEEFGPYGPYDDRTEAEEDRRGVLRTERLLSAGDLRTLTE